jgi:hypothetical protein
MHCGDERSFLYLQFSSLNPMLHFSIKSNLSSPYNNLKKQAEKIKPGENY